MERYIVAAVLNFEFTVILRSKASLEPGLGNEEHD